MQSGYSTYTAKPGQSLYDICLNTYGSLDYLVKLIYDNSTGSLNVTPQAGQLFIYNAIYVVDQQVSQLNYTYATSANSDVASQFDNSINPQDFNEDFDDNFD